MTGNDENRVEFYDYDLPPHLIAAHPTDRRENARLLVCDATRASIRELAFSEIGEVLNPGDLLVFNDVKVVRARLFATKPTGGKVELFFTELISKDWDETPGIMRCMTRSSKPIRPGVLTLNGDSPLEVTLSEIVPGFVTITLPDGWSASRVLSEFGEMPLPPYIVNRRESLGEEAVRQDDAERYQTVFAKKPGAVAAPTAGLHFSDELLDGLRDDGVRTAFVTLFVGPGTFKPVTAETLDEHEMHRERYVIPEGLADAIAEVRREGGRVVACGTTTARTLEAEALLDNAFEPGERSTDIFIRPGFEWKVCDGLITNFHLPKSTLLALVFSFAGVELMRDVYQRAIKEAFRFYSYGDAMFLTRDV